MMTPTRPILRLVLSRRIARGGDFSGLPHNISAILVRTVGTLHLMAETGNHLYGRWWRGLFSMVRKQSLIAPLPPAPQSSGSVKDRA